MDSEPADGVDDLGDQDVEGLQLEQEDEEEKEGGARHGGPALAPLQQDDASSTVGGVGGVDG